MADTSGTSPDANLLETMKSYVKTQKGFILAAEILLGFIIMICYLASHFGGYSGVAICEMVFAIIFFVVFMNELDKRFHVIHWVWSDMFRASVGCLLYLITSLVCVIRVTGDGAHIAAGVFGFFAGIIYAYDSYTIYLQLRSSAQQTAAPSNDRV
uniref:Proteolipid protein 2 n=1 Tax=Nothobranchius korthausae TaxID=1143690 RepID=A0A1A8GIB8_9TELE